VRVLSTNFEDKAIFEYMELSETDKAKIKRINKLIKSIKRDGLLGGIGKPERLRHIDGYSREIDKEHRLVYRMNEKKDLVILSCVGHYDD